MDSNKVFVYEQGLGAIVLLERDLLGCASLTIRRLGTIRRCREHSVDAMWLVVRGMHILYGLYIHEVDVISLLMKLALSSRA